MASTSFVDSRYIPQPVAFYAELWDESSKMLEVGTFRDGDKAFCCGKSRSCSPWWSVDVYRGPPHRPSRVKLADLKFNSTMKWAYYDCLFRGRIRDWDYQDTERFIFTTWLLLAGNPITSQPEEEKNRNQSSTSLSNGAISNARELDEDVSADTPDLPKRPKTTSVTQPAKKKTLSTKKSPVKGKAKVTKSPARPRAKASATTMSTQEDEAQDEADHDNDIAEPHNCQAMTQKLQKLAGMLQEMSQMLSEPNDTAT